MVSYFVGRDVDVMEYNGKQGIMKDGKLEIHMDGDISFPFFHMTACSFPMLIRLSFLEVFDSVILRCYPNN